MAVHGPAGMTGSTTACWNGPWRTYPPARPPPSGRRARGGRGCGSPSTPPPTPARTPDAPPAAGTSIMTPAGATAPARPSRAGNTSSWPPWGTCAPPGPRWPTWSAPRPAPAPPRRSGRSRTCGAGGASAPLVILDAGYSAAALTAALRGQGVHLLLRLASDQVFYSEPVTWPGKAGRPVRHGIPVACADSRQAGNPEPDETLTLPDTPQYGTVEAAAWHQVHPLIHGDRGYFAGWQGELPVLRGTVLRVTVEHLPDGRKPHKTMWLWHAGPAPLSPDELWRAYLARFDEEHTFKFLKGVLGLTAAKVRTPGQADRWVRLVMAAHAQLLLARPLAADLRRPWEARPDPARPLSPGRVRRGFTNIRPRLGTPAHVAKPAPARPRTAQRLRQRPGPALPSPSQNRQSRQKRPATPQV